MYSQEEWPIITFNRKGYLNALAVSIEIRVHKRAMGVFPCSLIAIDLATGHKWGYTLKDQARLEMTLEEVCFEKVSLFRKLNVLII